MYLGTIENIMALVDQAVESWSDIVVPIFVESPKSNQAAKGLGSAYLCRDGKSTYLVTALHVVTDANFFKLKVANICGKAVDIGGLKFYTFEDYDIAVAVLEDSWLVEKGLDSIKTALVGRDLTGWIRTGLFVAIGYPGTKNRLDLRYGKVDRYCHSITVSVLNASEIKTRVKDAILLSYDHKSVISSAGGKLGDQPDLYGMSGGPCLELLASSEQQPKFSFDVIGVLSEWHKDDHTIVAAPLSVFISPPTHSG